MFPCATVPYAHDPCMVQIHTVVGCVAVWLYILSSSNDGGLSYHSIAGDSSAEPCRWCGAVADDVD